MNARFFAFHATRWLLAATLLLTPAAHAQPTVVTNVIAFDELPDLTAIPNGYEQLNWSGLETITAIQDGYAVGVISRPNAAFNPYGYDATISSGTPFNLVSAYLTSGAVPEMQLEALGFAGANLIYDRTYTLNDSNSVLVTFNYAGVTQVSLLGTAGGPFVMDNLTVSSAAFTNTAAPPPVVPTNVVPGVTNVLGFDDLPDMTPLPDGYAQLNWTEFETIGEWDDSFGGIYENGLISPSNVVFNPYGDNASISRATPFNVISAYLTGGLPAMNLEVEGYISNRLAYDRTFALSGDGPTLMTFDYWGVTEVAFVPEPMTQFAMDNLSVSAPDFSPLPPPSASEPQTRGNSMVKLGTVTVSSVTHRFYTLPDPLPPNPSHMVSDELLDESAAGSVLPTVVVNFDTNNQFEITIAAPLGEQFVVRPPAGQTVALSAGMEWTAAEEGSAGEGTATVSFAGVQGPAPTLAQDLAVLAAQHTYFGFTGIESNPITNSFSFTAMTFTATVPALDLGTGPLTYAPTSGEVEFNYATLATNNPGPFVTLAQSSQAGPPPLVGILREPNGDVTLTFSGTLQWSINLGQGFVDVPGHPQGRYTVPKVGLASGTQFRARQ